MATSEEIIPGLGGSDGLQNVITAVTDNGISSLNFYNIILIFGSMSTVLLVFFMVMLSLMNQNLKGFVYLIGLSFSLMIGIAVSKLFTGGTNTSSQNALCTIFALPFLNPRNGTPCMSSIVIWFTFAYFYFPMKYNKQMNYGIITTMAMIFIADSLLKTKFDCNSKQAIFLGSLLGLASGGLWYSILHSAGANSLLYFNEVDSNGVRCSMPSKQTFKCSVYKNGELIS